MAERLVDFGPLPDAVDTLLQEGVRAHRSDVGAADALFRQALTLAPDALPVHLCLYKIHAYSGRLDAALAAVEAAILEAARQAGLEADWRLWPALPEAEGAARFALYSLKALAFVRLRRGEAAHARAILTALTRIDPADRVGAGVVSTLAERSA